MASQRLITEHEALGPDPLPRMLENPPMFPGGNAISAAEEQAVIAVIRSKRLFRHYGPNPGPSKTAELEKALARYVGTHHALAVTSGTGSLICALGALGVGPGDEVIVPAYTWISTPLAVVAVGAVPIIAEIDGTLTLDPADVSRKITRRTAAIVPVHMRGAPARMEELTAIAASHDLRIVEDAAQAIGGAYRGKKLGSLGAIGCLSFQFNKIITGGEGGALVTSDETLFRRAVMFHDPGASQSHDIPADLALTAMNLRMSELTAAVTLVQLGRLDGLLELMRERKRVMKAGISRALERAGGRFRTLADEAGDTGIALVFFLPTAARAARVVDAFRNANVSACHLYRADQRDYHVYAHWEPIMAQRTWSRGGGPWRWAEPVRYSRKMCPASLDWLGRAVHVDVNPALSEADVDLSIDIMNEVLERA